MSAVEALLGSAHPLDERGYGGGEELIRLALHIYTDPIADDALRACAIAAFDRFMGDFSGYVLVALAAWNRT